MNHQETSPDNAERSGYHQVGLHLDLDALRLVEVSHGRIKDWLSVSYPPGATPGSEGFTPFLKKTLADMPGVRHASLRVVGPTPSLQVRFLTLAKVRPRQISNLVYWTFRKEIPFDAAQVVFDYDTEGEVVAGSGQVRRIDATAYTVSHEDVNRIKAMFTSADLQPDAVIIPSFAMRSILRACSPDSSDTVLGLHVGEESSAIMFMKNRHVVAHRVFKTGMNAMLDVLRDRYPDWSASRAYDEMNKALSVTPLDEKAARIRDTVLAAFARLVQQVERSMSAFLVGRSDEEIKTIYIAGALAGLPSLVIELGRRLGLTSLPLNGFDGRTPVAQSNVPVTPEAGGLLAIALGAAMSDPVRSPNLLHTYMKRDREERVARTSRLLSACGVAGLVLLVAANLVVSHFNRGLRANLTNAQTRLEAFAPHPDQAMILGLVAQAARNSGQLKAMAERCLPVAAVNQLSRNTPDDIRLRAMDLDLPGSDSAPPGVIRFLVEGLVAGEPGLQESKLASYIMRLEDTTLFNRVVLGRSEEGRDGREQVLLFNLTMELEPLAETPMIASVAPAKQGGQP